MLPVAQVLLFGLAMVGVSRVFPQLRVEIPGAPWLVAGLAIVGASIALLGVAAFSAARTTVDPRRPEAASKLVVRGIYRLSRNPMYVGLFLLLLAWGCRLEHAGALLLSPLFLVTMTRLQIIPEERQMLEKFGEDYRTYTTRVRRWI